MASLHTYINVPTAYLARTTRLPNTVRQNWYTFCLVIMLETCVQMGEFLLRKITIFNEVVVRML